MYVIATAGHVDHGKSALLRALTGMEPDRWEEERRRGLTIDLGYVWTDTARGPIAFVDVPGHERFVGNMLAGVGPVPAVLFVVAADEGWMPQSAEHLLALHALGVSHGVLAVTKTDLMEPDLAAEEALEAIERTSLNKIPWVGVSARTGEGLPQLREALDDLVARLPASEESAPVRLWVDRGFTLRGAGRSEIRRGDALMTPGSYRCTAVVDARTRLCAPADLPRELLVHVGTATVSATVRPIGADTARLTLGAALPLRVGDRMVLRHDRGVAGGAVVLDVDPPVLNRRGAARRRATELEAYLDTPDGMSELRRRGIVREGTLRAIGVEPPAPPLAGDWLVAPDLGRALRARLLKLVAQRTRDPSAPPLSVEDARKALDLPDVRLVPALLPEPWAVRNGVIVHAEAPDTLAPAVREAVEALERRLAGRGFTVASEEELASLGLGMAEIAAAIRAGRLLRLAPGVVLLPGTVEKAVTVLAGLPQPFTASEAREALGTTRKVIVPLLEHLARRGTTRRDADGRHTVTGR